MPGPKAGPAAANELVLQGIYRKRDGELIGGIGSKLQKYGNNPIHVRHESTNGPQESIQPLRNRESKKTRTGSMLHLCGESLFSTEPPWREASATTTEKSIYTNALSGE
jgi:hypothetical protein